MLFSTFFKLNNINVQFINMHLFRTTQCSETKFHIQFSSLFNLRLQGTSY